MNEECPGNRKAVGALQCVYGLSGGRIPQNPTFTCTPKTLGAPAT